MTERKIEILAPAGSYASFQAALCAGADAVYAGGPRFGARAYAENFTADELICAIGEAHLHGKKLYLTVNTLLKDTEIGTLYEYIAPLYEKGLDAVIIQDIGVLQYMREHFPDLELHASTQMTITGVYGARFAEEQGFRRVVPARELSLEEIRRIREETGVEIECFVHGALCYCYSGQCLLSSMIGGRSGNRGQCAQPCRLPYRLGNDKKYFLSPKDICTLEILPDLIEAGIDSFKIEGRMKQPEYVAGVTAMYRKYTDLYLKNGREGYRVLEEDSRSLMDLYNRGGFSSGYYHTHNGKEMMALNRPNHAGVPAVKVTSLRGRQVYAEALTDLEHGDVIELSGEKGNHTIGDPVRRGGSFRFLVGKDVRLKKGDILSRTRNESLIQRIRGKYVEKPPVLSLCAQLELEPDSPCRLRVSHRYDGIGEVSCTVLSEEPIQYAVSRPMEPEALRAQLNRTGNSGFQFQDIQIRSEGPVFFPVSHLNRLRREVLQGFREEVDRLYRRTVPCGAGNGKEDPACPEPVLQRLTEEIPALTVQAETAEQILALAEYAAHSRNIPERICVECGLFLDGEHRSDILRVLTDMRAAGSELCAALPYIFREEHAFLSDRCCEVIQMLDPDSILIRNYEEYQFIKEHGFDKKLILDHNLYVFNRYGRTFWRRLGTEAFSCAYELNTGELEKLGVYDSELEVYGYIPVMVSAQCTVRTNGTCSRVSSVSFLTDRLGSRFAVRNCCGFCYNIIYNTLPVYLGSQADAVKKLRPRSLRVRFTIEDGNEVGGIMDLICDNFFGRGERRPGFRYTQGHFRRGIR